MNDTLLDIRTHEKFALLFGLLSVLYGNTFVRLQDLDFCILNLSVELTSREVF